VSGDGSLRGGYLAPHHGWRFPFYIAAAPGFLLALAVLFLKEPPRGQFDSMKDTESGDLLPEDFKAGFVKEFFVIILLYLKKLYRLTFVLLKNPAFLTATLGMAFMTYSLGGIQVWMPQFLSTERHYTLESANLMFGIIVVIDGILAALAGGWLGDFLLPKMKSSYYFVSAVSMALGVPVMIVALFSRGRTMIPA